MLLLRLLEAGLEGRVWSVRVCGVPVCESYGVALGESQGYSVACVTRCLSACPFG